MNNIDLNEESDKPASCGNCGGIMAVEISHGTDYNTENISPMMIEYLIGDVPFDVEECRCVSCGEVLYET